MPDLHPDQLLLDRLGDLLVDPAPPSRAEVAAFHAEVERLRPEVAAPGRPTVTGRLAGYRRRARRLVVVLVAALVALATAVSLVLVSSPTPSGALTRVKTADTALRRALDGHASHTDTADAVEQLATSVDAVPAGQRGAVPPGTGTLLAQACRALAAGQTANGAPLPAACIHPPPIPGAARPPATGAPSGTGPSSGGAPATGTGTGAPTGAAGSGTGTSGGTGSGGTGAPAPAGTGPSRTSAGSAPSGSGTPPPASPVAGQGSTPPAGASSGAGTGAPSGQGGTPPATGTGGSGAAPGSGTPSGGTLPFPSGGTPPVSSPRESGGVGFPGSDAPATAAAGSAQRAGTPAGPTS
jgi:hypothetical protein